MKPYRRQRFSTEQFYEIIDETITTLPDHLRDEIDNLDFVVEHAPTPEQLRRNRVPPGQTLLGLYEGIPLPQRGSHYGNVIPDKITIFKATIEAAASHDPDRVRAQLRRTVIHELAHFFGISDERLRELGAY